MTWNAHRRIVVRVEAVRYAPFVPHFLRIVVLVCPFTCAITAPYASMLVRPAAPCSRTFISAVISQNVYLVSLGDASHSIFPTVVKSFELLFSKKTCLRLLFASIDLAISLVGNSFGG